ncbi:MAG: hypothetical protein JSS27_05575 [Planctomycetes bacterium]|nr:hypothetical protein [Planctomycetota bacterium]
MWCRHCQQDVPALAGGSAGYGCARCGQSTSPAPAANERPAAATAMTPSSGTEPAETSPVDTSQISPLERWSSWELNEQLRHVERLIQAIEPKPASTRTGGLLRFDAGSAMLPAEREPIALPPQETGGVSSTVAWLGLGLGLGATVCGAVLSIWGFAGERPELWHLGMPILLAGQFALVLGLLLQRGNGSSNAAAPNETFPQLDRRLARTGKQLRRP